ncbi:sugar phosphate isomerase/epimerase family protein [Rhizohabitans arisaemae]|uniref:sugar phosphate isomerase/epimerase family protein n=1 Tax=Rhizohabitans arisaemae TaxID=2720610 RepID=UPI0024B1A265|nr:sugar phosphate isomerase/epimerase [Rhizohabitans arisaemae]
MRLGFLTACLTHRSLREHAEWASTHGYTALEVAAWPADTERPHTAGHIDVATLDPGGAEKVRDLFDRHGLVLSSLAYYENNLHPDPERRTAINAHLRRVVDAAALLNCPTVGTFVGRDPGRSVVENLAAAAEVFRPIVDHAGRAGVKVVIENCPMGGWHPDGYPGNLAYSPELWEWLAAQGLYLNFDPSHLVWLGIDPVAAVRRHRDRIAHVQAKDVEVFPELRTRFSVYGTALNKADKWDAGWWRYRIPGLGQIDWPTLVDTLRENGFDGVVSVEHEDPQLSGSDDRVEEGLHVAARTLAPLLG